MKRSTKIEEMYRESISIDSRKNSIYQITKEESEDTDKKVMGYLKQITQTIEEASRENEGILLLMDQRITPKKSSKLALSVSKSSPRLEKRNLSLYFIYLYMMLT